MDVLGWLQSLNLSFELDLHQLRDAMDALMHQSYLLERRLEIARTQLTMPRQPVIQWLARVKSVESEVSDTLKQGSQILDQNYCLGGFCPSNCWISYMFRRRVLLNLSIVEDLKGDAPIFDVVVDYLLPSTIPGPEFPTGIQQSAFVEVWRCLEQDDVGIVGLYGMGGVGKTSLLKRINNKFAETGGSGYDLVIWVVISRELNMERVQKDIGRRLGLSWPEITDMDQRSRDIFNILKGKRFVLLLDDLWEPFDLSSIGIPYPFFTPSKIVFTTRSEIVCARMDADKKIRVECSSWEESWVLFQKVVGEEALDRHPDIRGVAQSIVRECGGLPLAITTIGRAMALKTTIEEWNYAIRTLQKPAAEFQGMEERIYATLKFSYNMIPDDSSKSCFLFCSLYPEGFEIPIKPLIIQWIGQGYIDWFDDLKEATDTGYEIIQILTSACLLTKCGGGDSCVTMHDVVRDLAIWISRDGGKGKHKVLVETGSAFDVAPNTELWRRVQTISLAHTEIPELDDIPNCPNLTTLLLFGSSYLTHITDSFFQFMPFLKFLDLSGTSITKLPRSIGELVSLEFLDLSDTLVREIPRETEKLIKLKYLFLEDVDIIPQIPGGVIVHLLNLQMLRVSISSFGHDENERVRGIEELACLEKLKALEIKISGGRVLEEFIQKPQLMDCTRSLIIYESFFAEEDYGSAPRIERLALSPTRSCLSLGYMKMLRELRIYGCIEMEELVIHSSANDKGLLESLETMSLIGLDKLHVLWDIRQGCGFKSLRHIKIMDCNGMQNLEWLLLVPNLQTLLIESCRNMQEIVPYYDKAVDANTFSKLEVLILEDLPFLRVIFSTAFTLSSLKEIRVRKCRNLTRLPLHSNSGHQNTLESIKGEAGWWDNLRWEDETVKDASTRFFHPIA